MSISGPVNVLAEANQANEKKPNDLLIDIEHVEVHDDPRKWSNARKNTILVIISCASMIAGFAGNIQNPSIQQMEEQLHTSASAISWTISIFILVQGNVPLLWSAISEIKGRKLVYVLSLSFFCGASIVVAVSRTIALVIGMRSLQAVGSSCVMAIGAATLADIFDPVERGTKLGVYYMAPLLGPAVGPILGGVLTAGFDWRASFWFLAIDAGCCVLAFLLLFKDTFRRERSIAYQAALRRRIRERTRRASKESSQVNTIMNSEDEVESPKSSNEKQAKNDANDQSDAEQGRAAILGHPEDEEIADVKLTLVDINPLKPVVFVLRRLNNLVILIASGFFFGLCYSITYTCSRTLGAHYGYNSLKIGLVLLAFGFGNLAGSILGGRWSDRALRRLKDLHHGESYPEMRLESTTLGMWFLPPSLVGYAWVCQEHVHVSAICVMLFLVGFFTIWIYTSTLAYIVDSNVGRSSTAVACNSSFRGIAAFIAAEIAVPLQDSIGDGGLYTLWAGLMLIAELMILLVMVKGGKWRELSTAREMLRS